MHTTIARLLLYHLEVSLSLSQAFDAFRKSVRRSETLDEGVGGWDSGPMMAPPKKGDGQN
jgi:hypothetical protein